MREIPEDEKKEFSRKLGSDVFKTHGKKKYYSKDEINKSYTNLGTPIDLHCWGYSLFMTHSDFDTHHSLIGEACDYIAMKTEMVTAFTGHVSDAWSDFDFDLSWVEFPDFDISGVLDVFDIL